MDAFDMNPAVGFWLLAALLMAGSVGTLVFPLLRGAGSGGTPPYPRLALAVTLAVPALAVGLYLALGSPQLLETAGDSPHGAAAAGQGSHGDEEMDALVARLAARLKDRPNDAAGWALLARSYAELERYPEAVRAFARAVALDRNDAQLRADYADALDALRSRVRTDSTLP